MADGTGLGQRIFQARKRLELRRGRSVSQAEIGKTLGVTGAAVGTWEGGKKEPDLATIRRLAAALEVDPGWLAFGDEDDVQPEDRAPRGMYKSAEQHEAEDREDRGGRSA